MAIAIMGKSSFAVALIGEDKKIILSEYSTLGNPVL